jgi:ParB family chromosome partitioning protein
LTAVDPDGLAKMAVKKGMSVRDVEKLAKSYSGESGTKQKTPKGSSRTEKDADTKALEQDLSANIGMKVLVEHASGKESGRVTISYGSLEELDNLCRILSSMR